MERSSPHALQAETSTVPWSPEWSVEGIIEVLEPLVIERRRQRILEVTQKRLASVTVLMDAPHDPHNGAAVLRTCDALGVQHVHVVRRDDTFLIAGGVAKGSQRWVSLHVHTTPEQAVEALERSGFELIATHPHGDLTPSDLGGVRRLALVLGNEHDGIGEALTRAARRSVRIPMRGYVESLNVSVSAAILLSSATAGRPGDLEPWEQRLHYAKGLFQSVNRGADVLQATEPR